MASAVIFEVVTIHILRSMDLFDASTQTAAVARSSVHTQSLTHAEACAQTEDEASDGRLLSEQQLRFDRWEEGSALNAVAEALRRLAPLTLAAVRAGAASALPLLLEAPREHEDEEVATLAALAHAFLQYNNEDAGPAEPERAAASRLPCGRVAWSPLGSTLATAFDAGAHRGWCRHRSGVALWNPLRRQAGGLQPEGVLLTPSCVTALAFHPENPTLLAAGLASGELFVWDISAGGSEPLARSRPNDYFHREAVAGLAWAAPNRGAPPLLLSLCGEGKMHAWSLSNALAHPVASFCLLTEGNARPVAAGAAEGGKRGGRGRGDDGSDEEEERSGRRAAVRPRAAAGGDVLSGGCSLSVHLGGSGMPGTGCSALVGGDTGGVFECTLPIPLTALASATQAEGSSARPVTAPGGIARADNSLPWEEAAAACLLRARAEDRAKACRDVERAVRDARGTCVTLKALYAATPEGGWMLLNAARLGHAPPHGGPVVGAACSPFVRTLSATASADGRVSLWSSLLSEPLLVLHPAAAVGASAASTVVPVHAVAWSCVRPLVLAAACADGFVHVYDLWDSTAEAALVLRPPGSAAADTADAAATGGALSVAFNPVQVRALAVGYTGGGARVWRLPGSLSDGSGKEAELDVLKRFVRLQLDGSTGGAGEAGEEDTVNSLSRLMGKGKRA
jgi:WD40 repeat protein